MVYGIGKLLLASARRSRWIFTYIIRALRWQIILGVSMPLQFSAVYHPLMIGFFVNLILPGRVGEIARPAILKKRENVPFSLGITTVGIERILDTITLVILFGWMTATVNIDPNLDVQILGYQLNKEVLNSIAATMLKISVILLCVILIMNIPAVQRLLINGILAIPAVFSPARRNWRGKVYQRFCLPLTEIIGSVTSGLHLIRHPKKLGICLFYSMLIWLLQSLAFYMITMDSPFIRLSFNQMTIVFVIICFFIMLPSVPGFWGIWEAGGVFGLALFGVEARAALGFSLTVHGVLLFPVLLAGLISAGLTSINIFRVSYQAVAEQ